MEDFETIAQGLQMARPKALVQANDHLTLSHEEGAAVSRLPNSIGYNVLLRLMEGELEKLETEHMRAYLDKELFERTGLMAVAARRFYERVQQEVNYQGSEFLGNVEGEQLDASVEQMSPEELTRREFGLE
jgi:hypothetical protein